MKKGNFLAVMTSALAVIVLLAGTTQAAGDFTLTLEKHSDTWNLYNDRTGYPYTEQSDKWEITDNTLILKNGFSFVTSGDVALIVYDDGILEVQGNVTLIAGEIGLHANNDLTIRGNGILTATGGADDDYSAGIDVANDLAIEGGVTVNAAGTGGVSVSTGIGVGNALTISGSASVTASGDTRAIQNDYTVPDGYHYYVSLTTSPSATQLTGDGSTTIIGSSHKWARIIAQTNFIPPPTGLPDLTTAATWMYILIALSLALWGYVGYTYIAPRRKDIRG